MTFINRLASRQTAPARLSGWRGAARLLALACCGIAPLTAQAGAFPDHAVTFIVPFPAGSATDLIARIVGQKLSIKWGQSVIVDDRPGAGGNIGSEYVAKLKPDGYTVLWGNIANAISATLYKKLSYDFVKDFDSITLIAKIPLVLVANKELPFNTLPQMVQYAKTHPDQKLTYGSGGIGTSNHLAGAMFGDLTGIDMVHVPYKGTPEAYSDLIAGRISIMFDNIVPAMAQIKSGSLKPIAITSLQRNPTLPTVPTVSESGYPGFEIVAWQAIEVPKGTPPGVIAKINADTVAVLQDPAVRKTVAVFGAVVTPSTPAELDAFVHTEIQKWGKVIKESGTVAN